MNGYYGVSVMEEAIRIREAAVWDITSPQQEDSFEAAVLSIALRWAHFGSLYKYRSVRLLMSGYRTVV